MLMGWRLGLVSVAALASAPHSSGVESPYVRPPPSRALRSEEVAGCELTFTTFQHPKDDYFRGAACATQVHVGLASESSVFVSFSTPSALVPSEVRFGSSPTELSWATAAGRVQSYTSLLSIDPKVYAPPMGAAFATAAEIEDMANTSFWASKESGSYNVPRTTPYGLQQYSNPGAIYSSPALHTVELAQLEPGARYYYTTSADDALGRGTVRSFVFPKRSYPFTFGLTSDLGQTVVSNRSLAALSVMEPDAVLVSGDLSYADGWGFRWDTFGALAEALFSRVPVMSTGGNHEVGGSEQWVPYAARWPTPHAASHSSSALYWSVDVGPAHVIGLNSYDNFINGGDSLQREWLERDLAAYSLRRATVPWLVVAMHAPWYNSNKAHRFEAELMRRAYEPLLRAAGVDIVLSGHVHSYERSAGGVYDGEPDACGPVYLNLGDGGNRENAALNWEQPQPEWSAFRESSFGVGRLEFRDDRTASFEWRRDACGANKPGEGYSLDAAACAMPSVPTTPRFVQHIPTLGHLSSIV